MSMSSPHSSLPRRVLHQLSVDARRDRGLILMWLLLLTIHAVERARPDHRTYDSFLPEAVPMAVGLLLAWCLIRADHPGNADTAALTRPLGRGALWLAKMLCLMLGGLIPWLVVQAQDYRGYGLGMVSWFGMAVSVLLPACVAVFATCWLASLELKRGWVISLTAIAGFYLLLPNIGRVAPLFDELKVDSLFAAESYFQNTDLNRCRVIVGMSGLVLAMLFGWWRASMGRSSLWPVLAMIAVGSIGATWWPWNWRQLTPRSFTGKLELHIGAKPASDHQSLWSTLHVSGLEKDQVVAIAAFAPVQPQAAKWPPMPACSDFVYWDENDAQQSCWRWMNVDHTLRLSAQFPPHTIWVGDQDNTRETLAKVIADAEKHHPGVSKLPWKLRLAVHRLRRVHEKPLAEVLRTSFTASPMPGWRFDVVKHRLSESSLSLEARLKERWPLTVPNLPHSYLRVLNSQPVTNLLLTVHAPGIQQGICLHEPNNDWGYSNHFWHHEHQRPGDFHFPLPVIHQTLAGLKIPEWLQDARLALWWPDELGTIDFELTAQQMQELVKPTPKETKKP